MMHPPPHPHVPAHQIHHLQHPPMNLNMNMCCNMQQPNGPISHGQLGMQQQHREPNRGNNYRKGNTQPQLHQNMHQQGRHNGVGMSGQIKSRQSGKFHQMQSIPNGNHKAASIINSSTQKITNRTNSNQAQLTPQPQRKIQKNNLKITPKSENITTLPEKPVEQNSNTKNDNNISTLANSSLSLQSVNSNACQDNVTENLANTKEKTPMCLVNELARFNKIIHQYRLTDECGPAHNKSFTVTLKLGDEDYIAEGPSIKKAQHAAAAEAIKHTNFKHPPVKPQRGRIFPGLSRTEPTSTQCVGHVTPTVELNALAMKMGLPTVYVVHHPQGESVRDVKELNNSTVGSTHIQYQQSSQIYGQYNNMNDSGGNPYYGRKNVSNGQSYSNNRVNIVRNPIYQQMLNHRQRNANSAGIIQQSNVSVSVLVGDQNFDGEGPTLQAARHDAASKALDYVRGLNNKQNESIASVKDEDDDIDSDTKSPISLVHEIALKRELTVTFDVLNEKGPPHMKIFTTVCKVGDIVTEGEGNGKKISKKRAAEKMLDELKKLPNTEQTSSIKKVKTKRNAVAVRRKSKNLIRDANEKQLNPISKLMQIQQMRKEKEPVYTFVEQRGPARRREFVIQVTAAGLSAEGISTNKKDAKHQAAAGLLTMMSSMKIIDELSPVAARYMNDTTTHRDNAKKGNIKENNTEKKTNRNSGQKSSNNNVLTVADNNGTATVESLPKNQIPSIEETNTKLNGGSKSSQPVTNTYSHTSGGDGIRPKDQLKYLGQLFHFNIGYTNFPRGNHGDYLSLVTLSTIPPQICHGNGSNIELAQDEAARNALKLLSDIGLDNIKCNDTESSENENVKASLITGGKKGKR